MRGLLAAVLLIAALPAAAQKVVVSPSLATAPVLPALPAGRLELRAQTLRLEPSYALTLSLPGPLSAAPARQDPERLPAGAHPLASLDDLGPVRDDTAGRIAAKLDAVFSGLRLAAEASDPVPVPPAGGAPAPAPAPQPQVPSSRESFERARSLAAQGHTPRSYDAARDYLFSVADNVVRDGVRGVVDAYSGVFVPGKSTEGGDYKEKGDQNGDGEVDRAGMNPEHLWPQSFFGQASPMRSDLHHLLATFTHPNGVRGHLPFGVVAGPGEYRNNGGAKMGQGVFEPPDAAKGRVARGLLYFYVRYFERNITQGHYTLGFWNGMIRTLLDWNRRFPPTAEEQARNGLIERFQGNRNPFVDDPGLADRIGPEGFQRMSRWSASSITQRSGNANWGNRHHKKRHKHRHRKHHRHGRR